MTGLLVGHAYGRMGAGTPTMVPREKSRVCSVPELLHNVDAHNWSMWEGAGPTGDPALDVASWAKTEMEFQDDSDWPIRPSLAAS